MWEFLSQEVRVGRWFAFHSTPPHGHGAAILLARHLSQLLPPFCFRSSRQDARVMSPSYACRNESRQVERASNGRQERGRSRIKTGKKQARVTRTRRVSTAPPRPLRAGPNNNEEVGAELENTLSLARSQPLTTLRAQN